MRRVLLLEPDPQARKLLGSILAQAGYRVAALESADELLAALAPDVRLVVVAGEAGLVACRRVRRSNPDLHVVFLGAFGRRQEIVDALEAGADDVLGKPIAPDVLRQHLGAAERAWERRAQRTSLFEAIRDAASQGNGELVVKSGSAVARLFFHDGELAWLAVPGRPSALEAALGAPLRDRRDEARAVLDECRRTGQPFDEVIVALGLAPSEIVARRMRRWIVDAFADVRAMERPELLFLPGRRAFAGGHKVSLEELLGEPRATRESSSIPVTRTVPPPDRAVRCEGAGTCRGCADDVTRTIRGLLDLDAVLGATVVHTTTGQPIGAGGVLVDPDVLASQLRLLRSLPPDEHPGELVLTGATTLHLAHATRCDSAIVSVLAQRLVAPLALLRVSIGRVARELGPPTPQKLERSG